MILTLLLVSCSPEIVSPNSNNDKVPTEEELITKYAIDISLNDAEISQKIEENLKAYYKEMGSYRLIFTGVPKDYTKSTVESLSILTVKAAVNVGTAKNIDLDIRNIDFQNETINTGMFSGETIDDTINFNFIFPEDKIKTIASMSFDNLYNIREIILPDSITSIENDAFNNCQNIEKLTLGNGLKTIGDMAFLYNNALKEVVIPNSVTSIGMGAFSGAPIEILKLSSSLESIGDAAFDTISITELTIPASVKSIGMQAFAFSQKLTTLTYLGAKPNILSVGSDIFKGCDKLTTLIVPNADNPDDASWKTFLGASFTTVKKQ
ncbi:leucine-rich repeat domain-containing protein [Brachyspira hampsonii]|uniref:leucine-rich repeat domain-containing protein n=1 Tax=Brachyspira hampsonii TaxID=1287055 RepID=UPI0002ADF24E|nr:leucine-rich repeat domain-containing protein [Brachyspira hampsonii]ELV06642.1 hypothetical protein H263_02921 [Brachyspira hampsonii 30599]